MDEAQGLCAEGGHFGACTPVHVYVRAWRGGADLRGLGGRVAHLPVEVFLMALAAMGREFVY